MDPADRQQVEIALEEAAQGRQWERGLGLAEHLCEEEPDDGVGWFWRATCLWRMGRLHEALPAARRAVLLAPRDPAARRLAAELGRVPVAPDPGSAAAGGRVPLPPTLVEAAPTELPPAPGPVVPETTLPVGRVIEGRWEVRGGARGGMGEVLFVFDRELGRMAAVKAPLPEQLASEEGRARFSREAEAWIALGLHPNVCAAYFVHPIGGVPRLFIEYVDGGALDDWMQRHRHAPLASRLDLAIQLAAGMHHAHTFSWQDEAGGEHHGIVHRDLKPGNVLIGRDEVVRVTDFGLVGRPSLEALTVPASPVAAVARAAAPGASGAWSTVTLGDMVMGTPPYMPPEQWDGAHLVGPSVDIYAYGCILYELLCGRRPLTIASGAAGVAPEARLAAWEHLHRSVPPADPRELVAELDPELAALLLACLEKDPARRPGSMAAVRAILMEAYARLVGSPYPRQLPEATELLADTHNNQGVSFVTLGQPRRAEAAWRRALAVHPHHVESSYNLALLRWRQGGSDAEALATLSEVRRTHHASWKDDHLAGRLALCLGEVETALGCLRAASEATSEWDVERDAALAVAAAAWGAEAPERWREVLARLAAHGERVSADGVAAALPVIALWRLGETGGARRAWEAAAAAGVDLPAAVPDLGAWVIPGACLRRRVVGLTTRVAAAAVSRDGALAALAGEDGRIFVVEAASGEILRTLRLEGERARCLTFGADGRVLLVAGAAGRVGVWSSARGALERQLQIQPGMLGALAVTPDGAWVLGLGSEGSLTLWEAASGQRVASWRAHAAFGTCLVAPAADRVVSAGADGMVRMWELPEGRCLATLQVAERGVVSALAVSADGRQVLSAGEDRQVRCWEIGTGRPARGLGGHADRVTFLAYHPEGGHAVSASLDGSLRFWDLGRGEPLAAVKVGAPVLGAAASEGLGTVVMAHGGATLGDCRQVPSYRPGWALAVPLSVDATQQRLSTFRFTLAEAVERSGAQDWRAALDRLTAARAIDGFARAPEALGVLSRIQAHLPHLSLRDAWEERAIAAHRERVTAVALSPDGRLAVSAGADGRLVLWRLADGAPVWTQAEATGFETAAAFTPDGLQVVTGGLGHAVRVRDAASGRIVQSFPGHGGQITQVVASGGLVLSASLDHTVRLWGRSDGTPSLTFTQHLGPVLAAALESGERAALTADDTGAVLLWEVTRGTLLGRLGGHAAAVSAVALSPDGSLALTGDRDGVLRLFELGSGRCLRTLEGEKAEGVTAVAFSPDGRFAASGSRDGVVRIWEPRGRACLQALAGHTGAVVGLGFAEGGQRLLTAAADGTLRVWYCEWEPEVRPAADWDERALPYLRLFLHRHPAGPRGEGELRALLAELESRGFGWLRPEGVRRKLEEVAASWHGLPELQRWPGATSVAADRVARPGAGPAVPRALVRGGAVLAGLGVLAAIGLWRAYGGLRLNPEAVQQRRTQLQVELFVHHSSATLASRCDAAQLEAYLRTFREPYLAAPEAADVAAFCLERLAEARSVRPLLALAEEAGGGGRDEPGTELAARRDRRVAATLSRMGDGVVEELRRALSDRDPGVRATAALALVGHGSRGAIAALVAAAHDPDLEARQAAASVLPEVLASGVLPVEKGLAVVERLAADADAGVRVDAAQALALLTGRPVRRLAQRLAGDPDAAVRAAADTVLRRR